MTSSRYCLHKTLQGIRTETKEEDCMGPSLPQSVSVMKDGWFSTLHLSWPPTSPAACYATLRRNSENSEKYSHFLSCSPKNSFCCALLQREPVFYVEFDNNSVYIKKTLWKHILYYLCGYNVCKSVKNNYPSTFLSSSEQLQFKSGTKFCVI